MIDPPRLSRRPGAAATLIASARADEAPADAPERLLVALGVATGASSIGSATAAGAGAAGAAGGTGSAAVAASGGGPLLLATLAKWGVGVAVIGTLVGGGLAVVSRLAAPKPPFVTAPEARPVVAVLPRRAPPAAGPAVVDEPGSVTEKPPAPAGAPLAVAAPARPESAPRSVPPGRPGPKRVAVVAAAEVEGATASAAAPVEAAPLSPIAPAPAAAPPPVAPPPAPLPAPPALTLAREVALLDAARAALVAGDAGGALRVLDRYQREMARGALTPEAAVLRIEAQLAQGDRTAAEQGCRQFLRLHTGSAHAAHVRSLLEAATEQKTMSR
jgi:hypothetical protein